jgi:hypothetical protein
VHYIYHHTTIRSTVAAAFHSTAQLENNFDNHNQCLEGFISAGAVSTGVGGCPVPDATNRCQEFADVPEMLEIHGHGATPPHTHTHTPTPTPTPHAWYCCLGCALFQTTSSGCCCTRLSVSTKVFPRTDFAWLPMHSQVRRPARFACSVARTATSKQVSIVVCTCSVRCNATRPDEPHGFTCVDSACVVLNASC